MEGSVQRSASRVRVNVQLTDAETSNHLWAERFDKPLADLFDMQDEIVSRLANTLDAQLVSAEARRAEQAPNPNSMDLYFQGSACSTRVTPLVMLRKHAAFLTAHSLPTPTMSTRSSDRHGRMRSRAQIRCDRSVAAFAACEAKLTTALSAVPDHARAHWYLGIVDIRTKRAAQGIVECEYALALDRNLAAVISIIGLGKISIGRAEETEAHIVEALRLSPRDTMAHN